MVGYDQSKLFAVDHPSEKKCNKNLSSKAIATLPEVICPGSGCGINVLCGYYVLILSISSIVIKEFDKMKQ